LKNLEEKVHKLKRVIDGIEKFDDWVTQENWEERFEIAFGEFIKKRADADMVVFMDS
jgi:hypothetical protein